MKDYYEILGVPEDASVEDIKKRYRELVRQFHPDLNKGDDDAAKRMAEINEAYQVLVDPKKRAEYDAIRKGGGTFVGDPFNRGEGFDFFDSIFRDFFGDFPFGSPFFSRTAQRATARGPDVTLEVTLSLKEVVTGTKRSIRFFRMEACEACGGTGAKGGKFVTCDRCHGTGVIQNRQNTPFGVFVTQTVCPTCGGTGRTPEETCPVCRGSGVTKKERTLELDIPPGVEDNDVITLKGQGSAVKGGTPGDINVVIKVVLPQGWRRKGRDLYTEVHVPYYNAILGGKVKMKTATDEEKELYLEPGTQPGQEYVLAGEGVPDKNRRYRGDLHVVVKVDLPTKVAPEEKQMLERIKQLYEKDKKRFGLF
ncbi:DnaJ domain-containing protein [Coprothermobacteraceae bacterium]|nr:DnaJ domain-containing protein [Coprothermobacteraceae bacterium]